MVWFVLHDWFKSALMEATLRQGVHVIRIVRQWLLLCLELGIYFRVRGEKVVEVSGGANVVHNIVANGTVDSFRVLLISLLIDPFLVSISLAIALLICHAL